MNESALNSIVEFSQQHNWGQKFAPELVRRFVLEFISSSEFIFDLSDKSGRRAFAVLLDRVENAAGLTNLEILGMRDTVNQSETLDEILRWAKEKIPPQHKGIQVTFPEEFPEQGELSQRHGLTFAYDTCEMTAETSPQAETPTQIACAHSADGPELYEALRLAFVNNPETSYPPRDQWLSGFRSRTENYFVWRENGQISGFAHLMVSEDGKSSRVNTIGVLPEHRGRNIGRALLCHCLKDSHSRNIKVCVLDVSAINDQALKLYRSVGFVITTRQRSYKYER